MKLAKLLCVSVVVCAFSGLLFSQAAPNLENGFKNYGSYDGSHLDTVNVMNGNVMLHIPLLPVYAQRGEFAPQYSLYVTSKAWQIHCKPNPTSGQICWWDTNNPGIMLISAEGIMVSRTLVKDFSGTGQIFYTTQGYSVTGPDGSVHQFAPVPNQPLDAYSNYTVFESLDTSGYHLVVSNPDSNGVMNNVMVIDRKGVQYPGVFSTYADFKSCYHPGTLAIPSVGNYAPLIDDVPFGEGFCKQVAYPMQITDPNGNQLNFSRTQLQGFAPPTLSIDTLNRNMPFSFTPTNPGTADPAKCVSVSGRAIYSTDLVYYNAPDGTTQQIQRCFANTPIQTAFGVTGVAEAPNGLTATPLNQILQMVTAVLADGSKWTFDYDSYGDVTYVGLPAGGHISYVWETISAPPSSDGLTRVSRAVQTRTMNDNAGHSSQWSYAWTLAGTTLTNTVTDPMLNDTVHVFTALDGVSSFYETSTQYFQGAKGGQPFKQVDTTYSPNTITTDDGLVGNVVPTIIKTTLNPSGKVSQVTKQYDTGFGAGASIFGNVTKQFEYDWGQGSPGTTLLRETDTTYQWQVDSRYKDAHMLDLPATVVIKDGSGCALSQTDYLYDEATYFTGTTVSTQHVAAPNPSPIRGNQTTVKRWLAPMGSCHPENGTAVTSHTNWYDTGEPYQKIDPLGHTTTLSYDSAYASAYVTQTCSPQTGSVKHCVSGTYDFNTGVLTSLTGENAPSQASGNTQNDGPYISNFGYDSMFRIKSATAPPDPANGNAQAQTSFDYSPGNVFPASVQRTKSITGALSDSATNFFDGLGRTYQSQHALPGGTAEVDTQFDPDGHVSTVSNPYFSLSDPTYGTTTNLYDALDRVTQTTKQDGSVSGVSYDQAVAGVAGVCTTSTDEAGKQRRTCSDALGRLVEVVEPNPGSVATNATGSVTISGSEQATNVSVAITVAGSGFETPALGSGANAYQYHPTGSSWTFGPNSGLDSNNNVVGGSGITGNNSGFTSSNPSAPEGAEVAFLQGGPANYISQSLSGFQAGVNYTVSFQAAQRGNFNAGGEDFDVYLDSTFLATFNPASTNYALLSTPYFATTAGTHTLKFVGRDSAGGNANTAFIDAVQVTGSVVIPNSGFEAPAVGSGSFQYSPTGGSWTFGGGTGISANGSDFTFGNPGAPEGSQVAFIQFGSNDVFSQSLSGFQTGVSYTVSFSAAQRGNSSNGGQDFDVYLDTTLLGTFRPAGTSYSAMSTAPFTTTAGTHTLKFVGRDSAGGNNTAFIDAVQITGTVVGIADAGTVTVSVNGTPYSTSFGFGDNPTTIASRLATAISAGSYASATASGATINLTSKTAGTIGDYSISGSYIWNSGQFTNPSFTTSTSGVALSGAYNAGDIGNNPLVTLYAYDGLGNLLRVDQKGTAPNDSTQWRTRTFTYDTLSRLLTANNPESGTISYSYDADGNLLQKTSPAPNQTGTATQTVSYCYDELHRVTGKGYGAQTCPLATPVTIYAYDSGTNAIGKLTSLTDQAGTASYTYDILGRLVAETRTLTGANNASISKNLSYEYNLDGSLYKLHYPSGNVVTYEAGAAGLTLSAKDTGNNINYATSATYGPDSALTGFISGYSTSFAGITNAFSYNKRLQPINMSANAPGQTVFSIGYDFHVGNGTSGADNGNVYGITNYKDTTRSQTFTYDALNRIISAQNAGTDCTVTVLGGNKKFWGNNYTYDAWGNLVNKTKIGTACAGENLSLTADAHNWIHATGGADYLYDAAGNMTFNATPPTQNYTYDQENRLTGAAGYSYTYDGDGNRVRKSSSSTTGTLYWYMTPGIVGESDLSGNLTDEYVFFDGERVARKSMNGVFYYFSDHLKTASVITDSAGVIKSESDYYPWGGELQFVANDSNHYKFTGKERDSETQLDYFGARYYSNGLGRWVSADWSPTPIPVPYADFNNPQSLNLYGFVGGNPASKADPDGHCEWCHTAWDFGTGVVQGYVSSASFGAVGAPKSSDSTASLLGQALGSAFEGAQGTITRMAGSGTVVGGLAAEPETAGLSTVAVVGGGIAVAAGGYQELGAAKNVGAVVNAMAEKKGTSGGPRAGKPFTPKDKAEIKAENAAAHGGQTTCERCGQPTVPGQKHEAGVTPPGNETHVDHIIAQSNDGDGSKSNAQILCRDCNLKKGDK